MSRTKKRKGGGHRARGKGRGKGVSNPRSNRRGHRRRSNPAFLAGGLNLLKQGLFALIGLVIARQAPQLVLGTRNVGIIGYIGNVIAAMVSGFLAARVVGRDAANAVVLGGGLFVANRIIQDQFSPVGRVLALSGLGDPLSLSGIGPGYFPVPVPMDAMGNPIIPSEIRAIAPGPQPVGNNAGMGMASTRYRSRFAS